MSVSLPFFSSTPTTAQMQELDCIGTADSKLLYEAANNMLYLARINDYQEWHDYLGGTRINTNYYFLYVIFTKTNSNIVRWVYQSENSQFFEYSPWQSRIITYNNERYAIATPCTYGAAEAVLVKTGIWDTCPAYDTVADFFATEQPIPYRETYPITYRLTNCVAPSAPVEATVGDTVNVPLVMQEGYEVITPSTDILVTNNGVAVPHTYSNGTISFTMPDPD